MMDVDQFRTDPDLRRFADGETIFAIESGDEEMYVVVEGQVDLIRYGRHLERVEAGGFFGEMALLEHQPRTATAVAVGPTKLARIDRARFDALIHRSTDFAIEIMTRMAHRLRVTNAAL